MARSIFVILLAAVTLGGAAPAYAGVRDGETLYLDAHDNDNDGDAGPVVTSEPLQTGVNYVIDVQGTYTAYSASLWTADRKGRLCGAPDAQPWLPSPGQLDAPAGQDAELVYAQPWRHPCPALPHKNPGFQLDFGEGWTRVEPVGGAPTAPAPDHHYTYLLEGRGVPVGFRIVDQPTSDDYGVLTVTVRQADQPATPHAAVTPTVVTPRQCLSRRKVVLHLSGRRRDPIVAATARITGRSVSAKRHAGKPLLLRLDLSGRPAGRLDVLISERTRSGRVQLERRRFKLCARK
jgi:hypothetical protein